MGRPKQSKKSKDVSSTKSSRAKISLKKCRRYSAPASLEIHQSLQDLLQPMQTNQSKSKDEIDGMLMAKSKVRIYFKNYETNQILIMIKNSILKCLIQWNFLLVKAWTSPPS